MASASPLFARRELAPLGVETPLLVPSFSSRGYPGLANLFDALRRALKDCALVSAYDLHFGALPPDAACAADLVVVDSGGYGARPTADLGEPYLDDRAGRPWTAEAYHRLLDTLPRNALRVLVSFDHAGPAPMEAQIEGALPLLARRGDAIDMLCKPERAGGAALDVESVLASARHLGAFAAIGVTEKELGGSPIERCRALVRLRRGLTAEGLTTPVHVFGCLTPLSIVAYFLCGADVFDGLAWLRFAFGAVAAYEAEAAIIDRTWGEPDGARRLRRAEDNLAALRRLRRTLRDFCDAPDLAGLAEVGELGTHVSLAGELAAAAGAWVPEVRHGH